MRGRLLIVALTALACLTPALGANRATPARLQGPSGDPYLLDVWTTQDGLPQNSVTSIVQTRDGYLWLGTSGGLARFDGVRFTVFDVGNAPGLASNRILALCEDRQGGLWIGTERGGLTRYAGGTFTTYTTRDGLPIDTVSAIYEDRQGTLWLGTVEGLVRFADGRFTTYTTRDGLPENPVTACAEDHEGNLWIGTVAGLARRRAGQTTPPITADGFPDLRVRTLCRGQDQSMWVATFHKGLVRFRAGDVTPYTMANGLPSNETRCLLQDRAGNLWVGTDSGLALYRDGVFTTFDARQGLSNDFLMRLAEDREGNIWAGASGGLNRLKAAKLTVYAREQGLARDVVVPITEDARGAIWVGLTCGGLARYQAGRFITYTKKDGLPNDCVWSLLADRGGGLWVGTWGGGLTRLEDGAFFTYTTANSGLSHNAVLALFQDRAGALWVGTGGGGLHQFKDGHFTAYRVADGLAHDDVRFITETRDGALWLGTTGGVSRFKDGRFTNYTTADGLAHNFVRAIHEDDEGTLWLGTYGGGLNRFKAGRFTRYGRQDGLFDDVVSRILEDAHGNLWMSGNRGIFRAGRRELNDFADGKVGAITCAAYGTADGMKNQECNGGGQPAGWQGRDGRLWFPTAGGVVVVDPNRLAANPLPPPLRIERVLADKRQMDPRGRIEAPPGRGDLEIEYTALSFVAPEKVRFKYRLEGYDAGWVEAGARRTAYYTNIPPGQYRFRVTASNDEGVWNQEGAALEIVVLPPFYRTWWFMTLMTLGVLGLAVLAYERRVLRLKRAKAAQEEFARRLIASQEAERQRIAAELHDSLGQSLAIIKNRALFGLHAPADDRLARAQFDQICAQSAQAIDEVKEIAYNLRPYLLDRLGLTKALQSMLNRVADASGIRFAAEIDPLDGLLAKDVEINLYRIVQEGVNNIVKHAEAGEAKVTVRRDEQGVEITIQDDGKGFSPEAAGEAPRRGFGLIGMAERARMLGGKPEVRSAPGQGTTIRIRLALKDGR